MDSETIPPNNEIVELTASVVSAYVSNNAVGSAALAELISSVHHALLGLNAPAPAPVAERPVPAVPVKKSVTPDYLISLEDGRRYKSLKRHLGGRGLTPDQYRTKWGLAHDYPMVAANYAKQRSDLARSMGLGRKRVDADAVALADKPARRRKAAS